MDFFRFLFGRSPTISSSVADVIAEDGPIRFDLSHIEQLDRRENDVPVLTGSGEYPLLDVFCVLEYSDAEGAVTRRRVTLRKVVLAGDRCYVSAICHERRALRNFRTDRMIGFMTEDGEVVSPKKFFADVLHIDIDDALLRRKVAESRVDDVVATAAQMKRRLQYPLAILVAIARSDQHFHSSEIGSICTYAENELFALEGDGHFKFVPDLLELDRLCRLVGAMRPQQDTLLTSVQKMAEWPEARINRLAEAATRVVGADGLVRQCEVDILRDLSDFGSGTMAERMGTIASAFATTTATGV